MTAPLLVGFLTGLLTTIVVTLFVTRARAKGVRSRQTGDLRVAMASFDQRLQAELDRADALGRGCALLAIESVSAGEAAELDTDGLTFQLARARRRRRVRRRVRKRLDCGCGPRRARPRRGMCTRG
jgi:hypothetical protein